MVHPTALSSVPWTSQIHISSTPLSSPTSSTIPHTLSMPVSSISNIALSGYHFFFSSWLSLIIRFQVIRITNSLIQILTKLRYNDPLSLLCWIQLYLSNLFTPSYCPGYLKKKNSALEKFSFTPILHLNEGAKCGWKRLHSHEKRSHLKFMTLKHKHS